LRNAAAFFRLLPNRSRIRGNAQRNLTWLL